MWQAIKRIWSGRAGGALVAAEAKASTYNQIVVLERPDGFVEAAQFDGGDLALLYTASSFAFACMSSNARAAASLPWTVQRPGQGEDEPDWIKVPRGEHPLHDLLAAPTYGVRWSWSHLLEIVALHLYIDGNAYLHPITIRGGQRVAALEVLNPLHVKVAKDQYGRPARYKVAASQQAAAREFAADEIVHIQSPNPGSLSDGVAAITSAMGAISADANAVARIKANLINRIAPGLIITIKGSLGFNEAQESEFIRHLQDNYQASTKDGSPLVIGEDASVIAAPDQRMQTDFSGLRKDNRAEIVAVFGTPPPVIGDYEQATLQNFDAAFRVWWLTRLLPLLGHVADSINRQLVDRIYPGFRIWYDLAGTEVGLVLLASRAAVAQQLVDLGYPTNKAAARVGLDMPYVPELDTPNMQLAVAGRADNPEDSNGDPADPET